MYKTVFLEERVSLTPTDLSIKAHTSNIQDMLLDRLKTKLESKCISSGFVKQGSLEILHRSMGGAENGRFTGNYMFYVKLKCKVFHPETETQISCRIIKVNKMGAYAVFDEAMRVLLPRDLHLGNEDFDSLLPDDTVNLKVLRSRFQTNDPYISSVGIFVSRSKEAERGLKGGQGSSEEEDAEDAADKVGSVYAADE
jgi:DNA-directed RNA polymerase subunit E'/Rpb7